MKRHGCKFGQPHDLEPLHETGAVKWEVCKRCDKKFRWNKGYRKRVENAKYLEAHARNFAQPGGATDRLYRKIYEPETTTIKIKLS